MSEIDVLDPSTPPEEQVDLPQKRSGILGKIFAFLLGMIFAIVSVGGALYYIVTGVKTKKAANLIGNFAGFSFEELVEKDYVSEAIGDETLLQLLANLGYAAKRQELAWFCDYFPALDKYLGDFVTNLNEGFGIEMKKDVMITTPLKELPTYMSDCIQNAELGKILKATSETGEIDPLMMELAYGHEGEDYFVDDNGEIVMIAPAVATTIGMLSSDALSILDNVLLSHVIQARHDNNIIMYLLYGKKDVEYEIIDNVVHMLPMQIAIADGKVYDFYGAEMPNGYTWDTASGTYTDKDGIVHIIDERVEIEGEYATLTTEDGKTASLYYVNDENGKEIYFKETTIGDMDEERCHFTALTERMTLGEMIGESSINSNKILKHLSDCTIKQVPDRLNSLTFEDVFAEEIYLTHKGSNITDKYDNIIKAGDFIYYPEGETQPCLATSPDQYVVNGVWKYLLMDVDSTDPDKTEEERFEIGLNYSVTNDMGKLMNNMQVNMQSAKLSDLSKDGIIDMDADDLTTKVPAIGTPYDNMSLGDLTVNQMLTVMVETIKIIDKLNNPSLP